MGMDFIGQAPAVQTLNSAIHRINHYPAHDPADKYLGTNYAIHWIDIYPMDSTIHLLNNWGTDLKRGVENDIFWSEIESGFLEPGGTPTTIIPMNTPPPPPGLRPRWPRLVCRLLGSPEASWWLRSYSDRGYGLVTYSQAVNSSCTNNAPDVEAHLPIQIRSHPFTFYSYFQAERKTKTINNHCECSLR